MDVIAADTVTGRGSPGGFLDPGEVRALVAEHLAGLALDGADVVVLIPDGTRSAPIPLLYDAISGCLAGRVRRLRFLVALGTHQPMPDDALDRLVGCAAADRGPVEVLNHAWADPATFATLGVLPGELIRDLSDGLLTDPVPVRVNRAVVEADHVLVCGPVFPHEVVGFSGGTKYFFPGVGAPELINASHWLGALITSAAIIGTLGTTPVRAMIDAAADLVPTPSSAVCFVAATGSTRLHGLYAGPVRDAWAAAAALSAQVHVRYLDEPVRRVVSVIPAMYDEMWVAAKGMYKVEPVVADGGEVVIYAPHVRAFSATHDAALRRVGYHCRDYFTAQWPRFRALPWGVLAHSTHLYGAGSYDPETGVETPRVHVTLATGIPEEDCRAMNVGYRDPATFDAEALRAATFTGRPQGGALVVPKAGEVLLRLRA